jgi:hypothetical protein
MNTVKKTGILYQGADGSIACYWLDGGLQDFEQRWHEVDALPAPKRDVQSFLVLDNDVEIRLPFKNSPYILPDRSGVLVIFSPGSYVDAQGRDIFAAPNNAAIFNADGSLRCQVQSGKLGFISIHSLHSMQLSGKFQGMAGVLVTDYADHPPEWEYAIDLQTGQMQSTGQWVRY